MAFVSAQEILRQRGIDYVVTRKGKYTTKCPGCSQGYLNVEIKKDGVVWYCQHCKEGGGDKFEQRDHDGGLGPIKAIFDYHDENGALLFQVLRFEPLNQAKQFRQRIGPEQEKWSIKGVRIVPFKLPELIAAIAENKVVFVCEGEKDVLTLRRHNIEATCNPMGAGKWWPEFNQIMAGADVVICGDNDQPGRDHVALVARNLLPVAGRVRILDLASIWPEIEVSDDITDWFEDADGTPEALWEAVEKLPTLTEPPVKPNGHDKSNGGTEIHTDERPKRPLIIALTTVDASSYEGIVPPDRHWLVHDRIPMNNVSMLGGDGAAGKTTVALQLCVAVVAGQSDWLRGHIDEVGTVLFFTAEEDENEIIRRLRAIVAKRQLTFAQLRGLHVYTAPGADCSLVVPNRAGLLQETELYHRIKLTIASLQPKLVVLESSADLFGGNEIDRVHVRQFITKLRSLALLCGSAVLLLSHPSLSGLGSGSGLSGSTAWNNSVRSRLYFTHSEDKEQPNARELKVMKSNYGPPGEVIKCEWQDGIFVVENEFVTPTQRASLEQQAQTIFLQCLDQRNRTLDWVNNRLSSGTRYAPKIFANLDAAKPLGERESVREMLLAKAMENLLQYPKNDPVLTVEPYGPRSRDQVRLVRAAPADHKMQRTGPPTDLPTDLFKNPY